MRFELALLAVLAGKSQPVGGVAQFLEFPNLGSLRLFHRPPLAQEAGVEHNVAIRVEGIN